jgi:hypothetical protein
MEAQQVLSRRRDQRGELLQELHAGERQVRAPVRQRALRANTTVDVNPRLVPASGAQRYDGQTIRDVQPEEY